MNRAGPPGNGKGARQGANPEKTEAYRPVTDSATLRNHRIVRVRHALDRSEWDWLYWQSLINEGVKP